MDTGEVYLANKNSAGVLGNSHSGFPDFTHDGRYVVFQSNTEDLVPGVDNIPCGIRASSI